MEVEEETKCKKKLDEQKKRHQRQLRDIENFACMDPVSRVLTEWRLGKKSCKIFRKWTELLPEH